jgi:hypothetical protein
LRPPDKLLRTGLALSGTTEAKTMKSFLLIFSKKSNCPGMEIASAEGKRQRKRFFFEKKNQKTFTNSG